MSVPCGMRDSVSVCFPALWEHPERNGPTCGRLKVVYYILQSFHGLPVFTGKHEFTDLCQENQTVVLTWGCGGNFWMNKLCGISDCNSQE